MSVKEINKTNAFRFFYFKFETAKMQMCETWKVYAIFVDLNSMRRNRFEWARVNKEEAQKKTIKNAPRMDIGYTRVLSRRLFNDKTAFICSYLSQSVYA